jgi:energy-coupling factor transporter ATP-binding protein EcfA2
MSLAEEKIDDNIEIMPYKMSCDDIICKTIRHPLPGKDVGWFRMAIIGHSGSGKSNLVQNLTQKGGRNQVYNKKFENVFYISPSLKSMANPPKLPDDRKYESLNDLQDIIKRIQTDDEADGRTLLIMDDIAPELKQGGPAMDDVKKVMMNNRHLGRPLLSEDGNQLSSGAVSSIIVGQKYTSLPRYIRSQITHWCIFPPSSKNELSSIYEDCIHCDKDVFDEMVHRVKKNKYGFMFIDALNSRVYNKFDSEFIF